MTDNVFFGRKIIVRIGDNDSPDDALRFGGENADFRIDFSIMKTRDGKTQNSSNIKLYNLNEEQRARANRDFDRIELDFGYEGLDNGQTFPLFIGKILKITHQKQGQDIVSTFSCAEGGFAYRNTVVNKSFTSDYTDREVARELISSMKDLSIGDLSGIKDVPAAVDGRVRIMSGSTIEKLETLARNHNARVTTDNGVVDIIANDKGKQTTYVPFLNFKTGLLESPVITEKGVEFKCLIQKGFGPNRYVVIEDTFLGLGRKPVKTKTASSQTKDVVQSINPISKIQEKGGGVYRINSLTYSGSTHSNNCEIKCSAQYSDGFTIEKPENDVSPVLKVL